MKSLAGLRLDIVDDPDLVKGVDAPDFIKSAAQDSKAITSKDYENMKGEDFALVIMTKNGHYIPKYPVHDKVHAWAANETFNKTAHELPAEARIIAATFIKRACQLHDIPYYGFVDHLNDSNLSSNVFKLANQLSYSREYEPTEATVPLDPGEGELYGAQGEYRGNPTDGESSKQKDLFDNVKSSGSSSKSKKVLSGNKLRKKAADAIAEKYLDQLSDDNFGLVIKESGSRMFPIYNKENCLHAQIYLSEKEAEMAPKYRRQLAVKIASKLNRNPSWPRLPIIEKYASSNVSPDLEVEIHARKDFLLDKQAAASYDILLERSGDAEVEKVAEILEKLDIEFGLDKHWDVAFSDPYGATCKTAGEYTEHYMWDSGDERLGGLEIMKLAEEPSLLAGYLDPEVISAFQRDPIAIFESLPRPQKMLVLRAAKGDLVKRDATKISSAVGPDAYSPAPPKRKGPVGAMIRGAERKSGVGQIVKGIKNVMSRKTAGNSLSSIQDMDADVITKGDAEVKEMPDPRGDKKTESDNPKRSRLYQEEDSRMKVKQAKKVGTGGSFTPMDQPKSSKKAIKSHEDDGSNAPVLKAAACEDHKGKPKDGRKQKTSPDDYPSDIKTEYNKAAEDKAVPYPGKGLKSRILRGMGVMKLPPHIAKLPPKEQAMWFRKNHMKKAMHPSESKQKNKVRTILKKAAKSGDFLAKGTDKQPSVNSLHKNMSSGGMKPILGGNKALRPIVPTGPKATGVKRPKSLSTVDKSAHSKLALNDLRNRLSKKESPLLESIREHGVLKKKRRKGGR